MGIFLSVVERDGFISLALCSKETEKHVPEDRARGLGPGRGFFIFESPFSFHSVSAFGPISFGYDWAGLGARNFSQQGGAYKRVKVFDRGVLSTE